MRRIIFGLAALILFLALSPNLLAHKATPSNNPASQIETIEPFPVFRPEIQGEMFALCLHHVGGEGVLSISPEQLQAIIEELIRNGYTFVDSRDLRLYSQKVAKQPQKMAFLGFDDGYLDNYTIAAPVLRSLGVKATFFIVADKLDQEGYMTRNQIKELHKQGFDIGSHTLTHVDLSKLSVAQMEYEMATSRSILENLINAPVESIAYPCGAANEIVANIASKFYSVGFLADQVAGRKEDIMTIGRYGVFDYHWNMKGIIENQ